MILLDQKWKNLSTQILGNKVSYGFPSNYLDSCMEVLLTFGNVTLVK